MTVPQILYVSAFLLILIGLYSMITQRNMIRMIIGLNIADLGVNLFLVTIGYVDKGSAPIFRADAAAGTMVDPVPQALVLTSIVIGFGVTALALTLVMRLFVTHGSIDTARIRGLKW
jgi:multicomponent Na+:H+ antiporter subunit C